MRCIFENNSSQSNIKYNIYNLYSHSYDSDFERSKQLNSDKYLYFAYALYAGSSRRWVIIYKIHKRIMTVISDVTLDGLDDWTTPTYSPSTDTITVGKGYDKDYPAYLSLIEVIL